MDQHVKQRVAGEVLNTRLILLSSDHPDRHRHIFCAKHALDVMGLVNFEIETLGKCIIPDCSERDITVVYPIKTSRERISLLLVGHRRDQVLPEYHAKVACELLACISCVLAIALPIIITSTK